MDLCQVYPSGDHLRHVSVFPRSSAAVLWIFQEGSSEFDNVLGAAALDGGRVVLAGYSSGDWSRTNKGITDFAAVGIDLNGTVLWRWQVTWCFRLSYSRSTLVTGILSYRAVAVYSVYQVLCATKPPGMDWPCAWVTARTLLFHRANISNFV